VARLGEFSPNGSLLTFGSYLKITEVSYIHNWATLLHGYDG
jgi:hypothetical protein